MSTPDAPTGHYIGIDIESTGLDTRRDHLLEIAVVLFDQDFTVIDHLSQIVVPDHLADRAGLQELIASCNETVQQMHQENHLWAEIYTALAQGRRASLTSLDEDICAMLTDNGVSTSDPLPLLGSSPNSIDRPPDRP